ncbi:hypothetical protein SAMN05443575_1876 [Jatrophihabitans endophyticus]|uniref:Flagellar FliJ protein n=1 Tax=Jatrophihabitans endophyticus TaxID=1206085 RepID=A0A1M5IFK9_9ACTN|nr:hypothetical protein [Jatrophihabitans endophyticus]SHG27062.1 hypothetical protein SAMN05443575_1876 [Jatrophihabitans endophyticus]
MTPRWMSHLVRARQSQEDTATQRLAFARRAQARAHAQAKAEAARVDAMTRQEAAVNAGAFVAAAVALQSAAATHAAAVDEAFRADEWVVGRQRELSDAAKSRYVAEELRDRARAEADREAARIAQRDLDETAAIGHARRTGAQQRGES